jgi:hypothetical protein
VRGARSLFAVAASAIRLKLDSDDEGTGSGSVGAVPSPTAPSHICMHCPQDVDPNVPALARTTTGIISNRRPVDGVAADAHAPAPARGLSLMAAAKQAAARRILYARFFRGPVLGSDMDSLPAAAAAVAGSSASARAEDVPGPRKKRKAAKNASPPPASDTQSSGSSAAVAEPAAEADDDEARRAARRARKAARAARRAEKEARRVARRVRREARAAGAVDADAALMLVDAALTSTAGAPEAARSKKRRRATEAGGPADAAAVDVGVVAADDTGKKPRKTENDASAMTDVALAVIAAVGSTPSDSTLSTDGLAPKKKKKRKERDA